MLLFCVNQILDFLPLKCCACEQIFCKEHFRYDSHNCSKSYLMNKQVPICPLCNNPVPQQKGESADLVVGQHIDRFCQSDPALKKRSNIFTNKCSLKGCKQKEMMSLICKDCGKNFCIKHRHPIDHSCDPAAKMVSKSGAAALQRLSKSDNKSVPQKQQSTRPNQQPKQQLVATNKDLRAFQAGYNEDEALARALQQSMIESANTGTTSSELDLQLSEDQMLEEAIAASKRDAVRNKDKCLVS